MEKNEIPYTPTWLYRFFAFLRGIPIAGWLLGFLILVIGILTSHVVAWTSGVLISFQFNYDLAGPTLFFVFIPALWLYLDHISVETITEYHEHINAGKNQTSDQLSNFLSLPGGPATIIYLIGIANGFLNYQRVSDLNPLYSSVLPVYSAASFVFVNGLILLLAFRVFRQGVIMGQLLDTIKINLFDPSPIYNFTRFSSRSIFSILIIIYFLTLISSNSVEFLLDPLFLVVQVGFIGMLILAFFIQLRNTNLRMRDEKKRLISEIGGQLNELIEESNTAAGKRKHEKVSELQESVSSLRENWSFIKEIPTWPWEPATVRTILFPLLFPLITFLIQTFLADFIGI